jgi:uncharacterized membrane protein
MFCFVLPLVTSRPLALQAFPMLITALVAV